MQLSKVTTSLMLMLPTIKHPSNIRPLSLLVPRLRLPRTTRPHLRPKQIIKTIQQRPKTEQLVIKPLLLSHEQVLLMRNKKYHELINFEESRTTNSPLGLSD